MFEQEERKPQSFGREVRDEVVREASTWLRWAAAGAFVGTIVFGSLGLYLLGFIGMVGGAGIGAVLGGLATWIFYLNATTL